MRIIKGKTGEKSAIFIVFGGCKIRLKSICDEIFLFVCNKSDFSRNFFAIFRELCGTAEKIGEEEPIIAARLFINFTEKFFFVKLISRNFLQILENCAVLQKS